MYLILTYKCAEMLTVSYIRFYLWGESIADRVDVVARWCRTHKGVRVAGEAMAIGGQTVGGAAVSARQTALVHGGWR